jgi:protein CpxP
MRLALATAALAMLGTAALAQTSTQAPAGNPSSTAQRQGSSSNAKPAGSPDSTGAIQPGANSFTEGQARSRIEAQGFNDVTDLRKDDQGIWRGKAMRDGKSANVMLDFKGNVATQ